MTGVQTCALPICYVTKENEIVLTENTVLDVVLEAVQPTEPAGVETSVVEESSESV